MENLLLNFDKNGQKLLKQISTCISNKLIQQRYYTLKQLNCEQIRLAGQRIVHECYMTNADLFCNAFQEKNRNRFMQLIDNEDRSDFSLIRTLSSVGQKCTPKIRVIDMRPTSKINLRVPSSTS